MLLKLNSLVYYSSTYRLSSDPQNSATKSKIKPPTCPPIFYTTNHSIWIIKSRTYKGLLPISKLANLNLVQKMHACTTSCRQLLAIDRMAKSYDKLYTKVTSSAPLGQTNLQKVSEYLAHLLDALHRTINIHSGDTSPDGY